MPKGLIIGGEFGSILVREKHDTVLELGELMVADTPQGRMLLQVFDLIYGSQLTQQNLELVSGLKLEEDSSLELLDGKLRNYVLARLKSLALIGRKPKSAKLLPKFFTPVDELKAEHVSFLTAPSNPVLFGDLRSGSKVLDVPVCIDGRKALSHHLLIAGTTGRGKSVFMINVLWGLLDKDFASLLVLDPHDEYFEKLKLHPSSQERLVYYTPRSPPPGARSLKINLSQISPRHFNGVHFWSDPQRQALNAYYNKYGERWVESVLLGRPLDNPFHEGTLAVVKRVLMQLLSLQVDDAGSVVCRGVFDLHAGSSTISDIVDSLHNGNTVVIDTSSFHGSMEVLVGSMIANKVLASRKRCSLDVLKSLPVISIVLEEAPRVIGREVLERGPNVFSAIAREGRKFQVGLIAITQLPSLIPRQVLANMNTKIIFGIELRPERHAIIESAAQDLSSDERMIACLDKGEIIVTSNFLSFAMPLKVRYEERKPSHSKTGFGGVKL